MLLSDVVGGFSAALKSKSCLFSYSFLTDSCNNGVTPSVYFVYGTTGIDCSSVILDNCEVDGYGYATKYVLGSYLYYGDSTTVSRFPDLS